MCGYAVYHGMTCRIEDLDDVVLIFYRQACIYARRAWSDVVLRSVVLFAFGLEICYFRVVLLQF
jgi:hypothetical protein